MKKIIGRDLKRYFQVKNEYKDAELFRLFCYELGGVVNIRKLSKEIDFSENSLKNHLKIFLKSSLLLKLLKWDSKLRKIISSHSKYYVASPSLAMSELAYSDMPLGSYIGHLVENYVYQRLLSLTDKEVMYISGSNNREIDFYIPDEKIAIEVKFTDKRGYVFPMATTAKKLKLKTIFIAKDYFKTESRNKIVPVYFL